MPEDAVPIGRSGDAEEASPGAAAPLGVTRRLRIYTFCVVAYTLSLLMAAVQTEKDNDVHFAVAAVGSLLEVLRAFSFAYFQAEVCCLRDSSGRAASWKLYPCYSITVSLLIFLNLR